MITIEEVYKWLEEINKRYPPFDPDKWVPPTQRWPDKTLREISKLLEEEREKNDSSNFRI